MDDGSDLWDLNISTTQEFFHAHNASVNDTNPFFDEHCSIDYDLLFYCRALLSAVAFFGNISFIFVVLRVRAMRTIPNVHFINLAAADTIVIVTELVNLTLFRLTLDGHLSARSLPSILAVFPKVWIFVTPSFLCTALLTITLISIERYIAVCHPLKTNSFHLRSKTRVVTLIVSTWVLGAAMGAFALNALHYGASRTMLVCWLVVFAIFTVFPLFIVAGCYTLVVATVIKMRNPRDQGKRRKIRSSRSNNEERNVLVLCVAITLLFLVCFTPLAATQTISAYSMIAENSEVGPRLISCMQTTQTVLLLIHLAASPLLYNCGSKIRRKAFRSAFYDRCRHPSAINMDDNSFRTRASGGLRSSSRLTTAYSECNV